ncbi:uncharacterized protein LOC127900013 [Citrus sinensis]|uniref:uncharacterized protein LOC127900013 n=1 Tax=Citrus sinensis TaxID=2711 RepID=UPI0022789A7E|nr:uncharacterized protein LOC127900013 [Citrus sinensis]
MSAIFSLLIFFLFVSMHACSARHLGVINNESAAKRLHFCGKGCDEVKVLDLKNASERGRNGDGIIINRSNKGSAITHQEQKDDSKAALLLLSGSEKFESSSHVGLLKATRFLEGSRRRAIETNNNKAEEDVAAATDYEPPHQTPPIHNSKP